MTAQRGTLPSNPACLKIGSMITPHKSTPKSRARPKGVLGAEVWVKLVDAGQPAPTDPAVLSFLTLTTRPTVRTEFKAMDGGKTAVYMLRWVNTRGEKGPWSEICSATVAA